MPEQLLDSIPSFSQVLAAPYICRYSVSYRSSVKATLTSRLVSAGADVHQQLQESAVAAACVAIAAVAGPALLAAVDGQSVLQEVLWGYEQLVLACKVGVLTRQLSVVWAFDS